jgi:hypothetical protein
MQIKVAAAALAAVLAAGSADAGVRVVRVSRRPVVVHTRPVVVASHPVVAVRTPALRVTVVGTVSEKRGHGRLHVNVDPERARVYVDGRYQGRGDVTRTLREGRHTVRVVLADGREAVQTVHVDAGHLTRVRLDLNG